MGGGWARLRTIPLFFFPSYPPIESATAAAEGGANSPVATTTAISAKAGQESTTASAKPKRTRGKSTGAKPRGRATMHVILKVTLIENIIEAERIQFLNM
jgi:hypothetical protein